MEDGSLYRIVTWLPASCLIWLISLTSFNHRSRLLTKVNSRIKMNKVTRQSSNPLILNSDSGWPQRAAAQFQIQYYKIRSSSAPNRQKASSHRCSALRISCLPRSQTENCISLQRSRICGSLCCCRCRCSMLLLEKDASSELWAGIHITTLMIPISTYRCSNCIWWSKVLIHRRLKPWSTWLVNATMVAALLMIWIGARLLRCLRIFTLQISFVLKRARVFKMNHWSFWFRTFRRLRLMSDRTWRASWDFQTNCQNKNLLKLWGSIQMLQLIWLFWKLNRLSNKFSSLKEQE